MWEGRGRGGKGGEDREGGGDGGEGKGREERAPPIFYCTTSSFSRNMPGSHTSSKAQQSPLIQSNPVQNKT